MLRQRGAGDLSYLMQTSVDCQLLSSFASWAVLGLGLTKTKFDLTTGLVFISCSAVMWYFQLFIHCSDPSPANHPAYDPSHQLQNRRPVNFRTLSSQFPLASKFRPDLIVPIHTRRK